MTIQQLLTYTVQIKASDLHLVAGVPPMVRLDGSLVAISAEAPLSPVDSERLIFSILSTEHKTLFETNKELDLSLTLADLGRFRVNVYYQKGTVAATLRVISNKIPTIDELGLPKICHDFANKRQGFILITGPTGSGKSTTLAAILNEINATRPAHIVTVEDPIEYIYTPSRSVVSQRELHTDTHNWNAALRAILREDPDVVLIGEMRDFETISSALTIAETGHLVFATLHTNSAAQTIDRIVDVFPENQQPQARAQLASNIEAVLSQRLLPKIAGGRVAAYELMLANMAVRNAIREARTHMIDNIIQTSSEAGMNLLETSLAKLVKENLITRENAESFALRPSDLARYIKGV
jgi:twitching motility protein PilT